MKPEQKALRLGAAVITLAIVLRLAAGSMVSDLTALFTDPSVEAVLFYAGTGRLLPQTHAVPEPPQPSATGPTEQPESVRFDSKDVELVSIKNYPGYTVDISTLLQQPLQWQLQQDAATVLILHSHTTESYENTDNYTPSGEYRTLDENCNMVSIGKCFAAALESHGIRVLHSTTLHDYPSYDDAYTLSRQTVENYLAQYPSVCMVLDLHRDAYEDTYGNQASDTVTINGRPSSRIMLVAGTDADGAEHPNWQENLALAVKLHALLEKEHPGLCRPITLRRFSFNQELCPGYLLVEVGTAGDDRQEAMYAAELLADAVARLSWGSDG